MCVKSINCLGFSLVLIQIKRSSSGYVLGHWTFFWVHFLRNGTFSGVNIWPHSHLPFTSIPIYTIDLIDLHYVSTKLHERCSVSSMY